MTDLPAPDFELRPKTLAAAMLRRFGETEKQARDRILKVAVPAAGGLILVQGLRSWRSAQEDGALREIVIVVTAVVIVAVLVGIMLLAHARQRITLEGDQIVVRTLFRTRSHPRLSAQRAVTTQLVDLSHTAPATFVVDDDGRCLVAMSWQQFEEADVHALLQHLGVPHEDRREETITIAQMRSQFPGAFTFSRRHPWATGFLAAALIVAAIIPLAIWAT